MSRIRVNNVELSYHIYGSGYRDLLFVHGYALRSTGDLYAPLYKFLEPHFRIIALDLRGHGGSAHVKEGFDFNQMAGDIVAACAALDIDRPLYAGHSLGGLIGLASELIQPGLFRSLVLLNPAAASGAKGVSTGVIDRALREHGDKEAMRSLYQSMYVREVSKVDLDNIIETACMVDPTLHEQWLKVVFPKVDISGRLNEITPPVLLLNGARDIVIPLEAQHQTALGLQCYKEVILSNEGHMAPLESPERIAREIINFSRENLGE